MRIGPDTADTPAADDSYLGFTLEPTDDGAVVELDDSYDPASVAAKEAGRRLQARGDIELAPTVVDETTARPMDQVPAQTRRSATTAPAAADAGEPRSPSPIARLTRGVAPAVVPPTQRSSPRLPTPAAEATDAVDTADAAEAATEAADAPNATNTANATNAADTGVGTFDPSADIDGAVLVLEHPMPWAPNPLDTHTLPTAVRARLRSLDALGVRIVLAQRPDGEPGRALFCSVPDHGGLIIRRDLRSLDEVADLDLETALRQAVSMHAVPEGYREAEPQFLVSAHASADQRHRGGGIASAMMLLDPDNTWESCDIVGRPDEVSVVVLPKGQLSTGIRLADATMLVDAGWQDRVVLGRFAGRLQDDDVIRLAETCLRQRLQATIDAAVEPVDAVQTPIATGQADEGATTITRVATTWRVFPSLLDDLALARMRPELSSEPHRSWRVVVDRSESVAAGRREVHLSVVEIGDEEAPGGGVHEWDSTNVGSEPIRLPNPTVVGEVSALAPGRALDLGCAPGRHALWLAENGWQVTGVDFSRSGLWRMAEEAGQRRLGVRAELADLRLWTPGGTRFDLILVSNVHVEDVFQRTSPWLSPTGRIVVIGPAMGSPAPDDAVPIDYVHLAARATGARLRVLRAGEVERTDDGHTSRDAVVVAAWPT